MAEQQDTALRSRRRQMSPELAVQIFLERPRRSKEDKTYGPSALLSKALAERHDILERTVRNIWNRHSWADTTRPFWTEEEIAAELQSKSDNVTMPGADGVVLPAKDRKRGRPKNPTEDDGESQEPPSTNYASIVFENDIPSSAEKRKLCDPFARDW
eukprot:CAMPEP_0181306268 /NCGR_PEP_ID=MMETSP1101-20121128/10203_1 /TAXON_ID=46948 /ORGANISM="Rhodomonas abbreviata, Strain Caron Lab Isolate" /LENGTH=156 /DNA_ID=CAMNT_0023412301 /DNA_START=157 /DNA_END=624 /DNA_ORIENTATION=-